MANDQNRRKFLETAAATTAVFTIVPRHVLGGPGVVAPSDKITLGHIGVGTEGLREIQPILASPEIQIISVCDPNQHAAGYRDWSKTGIRDGIRRMLGDSNWTAGGEDVIPGGRDVAKNIIDTYYSKQRSGERLRGCSTYADFREMLTDAAPGAKGFDWDVWLGREADRPYHPNYPHAVFRGWYDFGGGSMADMGHYSLWTVFNALELSGPTSTEPMLSHNCVLNDDVAVTVKNDFSFPTACSGGFRYPPKGQRPAVDFIWSSRGMRPATPDELD